MSEIEKQIVPIIAEKLGVNESEVTLDASFTNDLGADSLDTVELMLDFEKKFGIAIPDDQQENIVTVGDVVRLIEEEQKKNQA
ncbi:MAG: acyl carrier protein [Bacteroidales bacterium]|jgi:acyl carrier protein|nr:acyl carrier protein [Bacteroidales bacterium]